MTVFRRNNVEIAGRGATPMIFAHGHRPHLSAPAETIAAMRKFLTANTFFKEVRS